MKRSTQKPEKEKAFHLFKLKNMLLFSRKISNKFSQLWQYITHTMKTCLQGQQWAWPTEGQRRAKPFLPSCMLRRKCNRRIRLCSRVPGVANPSHSAPACWYHLILLLFKISSWQQAHKNCRLSVTINRNAHAVSECLGSDRRQNLHKHIYSALSHCSPLELRAF